MESRSSMVSGGRTWSVGVPWAFSGRGEDHYASKVRAIVCDSSCEADHTEGEAVLVDLTVAICEYPERKVLLVVVCDVTERMERELELIQSSKMATLGEMVAGVAHELNQPLSVMKTASGFLMKKVKKGEKIDDKILLTLAEEMDRHVDRATEIVHHVLEFGRKSEPKLERIAVNDVLRKAFGLFGQQLRSRGIDVVWEIQEDHAFCDRPTGIGCSRCSSICSSMPGMP